MLRSRLSQQLRITEDDNRIRKTGVQMTQRISEMDPTVSDIDEIDDERLMQRMKRHVEFLTDRLELRFELLNKLLRIGALSDRDCRDIREVGTTCAKAEKLLEKILEKSKVRGLVHGLQQSKQVHLANFLIADGVLDGRFGDAWPLNESETRLFDANQESLTDNMDTASGLLEKLVAKGVISDRQKEFISSKPCSYGKNEALLDILRRSSVASYQTWIKCLFETNQKHIAEPLLNGHVVVPIHFNLSDETAADGVTKAVDENDEDIIVSKMVDLLANKSEEESGQILEKLHLKLVAARATRSICLYFLCKTLQDCLLLDNLLISGRLKANIERIFSHFLSTPEKSRVISVTSSASEETFRKCKMYFEVTGNFSSGQTEHDKHTHAHSDGDEVLPVHEPSRTHVGLSIRKRKLLRINHEILINIIDAENLLEGLYAKGVIDAAQKEDIALLRSDSGMIEALLNIMETGSSENYKKIVRCLRENNQEDVADVLQHGGVIARIEAAMLGTEEMRELTKTVVVKMNGLLRDKKSPGYSLLHELTRLQLIAAGLTAAGDVAVLYFHLRTPDDLMHLYELKQCHQLKSFVESVFNNLLPPSDTKQKLAPIKWSTAEYKCLQQYLLESEEARKELQLSESRTECVEVSTTHINELPLELLDIILRKAFLMPICNRCDRFCGATEADSCKILSSVSNCWFERIKKRQFISAITRHMQGHIQGISKEMAVLRNNWKYVVENLKPKGLPNGLRYFGCLTDYQLRTINARKHNSAMSGELLSKIRSIALSSPSSFSRHSASSASCSVYKTFIDSLRHNDHDCVVDALQRGGVAVKVHMVYQRAKHFNAAIYHQKVVEKLNELRSETSKSPARKLLRVLDEHGIDFLNASEDKEIVIWLRCRHASALNRLKELQSSGKLLRLMTDLIRSLLSFHWPVFMETKVTVDKDEFQKELVVLHPTAAFKSELNTGDRWVSGVTKLHNQVYVMCHSPSILLVYADLSPFKLLREIETKAIRKPLDVAASPASNCLYVSDRGDVSNDTEAHENSSVWKVTSAKDEVSMWLSGVENPFTLSVACDGRVLMLRWVEPPRLEIYGSDARLIRIIRPPPTFEYPRHAVETPLGTWIICYWVRHDKTWGVCEIGEVDRDEETAEIVRKFDPVEKSTPLNHTYHLALDSYGRVFVADNSNNRVVLFDPFFRWSKVLLTESRDGIVCPSRVHFDPAKRQLIVVHGGRSFRATPGAWGGRKLGVYEIM